MRTQRDTVLYVTVDEDDYFRPGDPRADRHQPNLERLSVIAAGCGLQVEPVYCADLTRERLSDPGLLALFGAGSFPEWFAMASDPVTAKRLAHYGELLRTTRVPMFAVCGSHQFLAAAFHGWDAVGHMAADGEALRTTGDELRAGRSLIPSPRMGEVGIFPLQIVKPDPIFEELPESVRFVQYHRDMVLSDRHPGFSSLLAPDRDRHPVLWATGQQGHRDPVTPPERCAVQLIRYDDPDRLLYSAQFHPELPSGDSATDDMGARLLTNFFHLAQVHKIEGEGE